MERDPSYTKKRQGEPPERRRSEESDIPGSTLGHTLPPPTFGPPPPIPLQTAMITTANAVGGNQHAQQVRNNLRGPQNTTHQDPAVDLLVQGLDTALQEVVALPLEPAGTHARAIRELRATIEASRDGADNQILHRYLAKWQAYLEKHTDYYEAAKARKRTTSADAERAALQRIEDNNERVWILIDRFMTKTIESEESFVGILDDQNELQAGAGVRIEQDGDPPKTYLYIEDFTSAPWNVPPTDAPADPRATRGGGTALMQTLVRKSMAVGCEGRLMLSPLANSAPWYEKLGFRFIGKGMKLSEEAAQALLQRT